ncbi:MAG: hypothetical protein GXO70_10210 [Acidobacteria bacterium]|nr:hypothetical protein [Acidobacteriota bacterium]
MAKSERFAVIGHPVSHSLSPQLHQFFMNESGVKGKCFRATGLHLPNILKMLHELDISHFNVTHPYKESIREHLDSLSSEALQIGAVNTVMDGPQKGLVGGNTDHAGVRLSLSSRFPNLKNIRVLVVGAGGAARAAVFTLCEAGADVQLTNRNQERGRLLAEDFSLQFLPLSNISSALSSIDIVIWTIPGYPPGIRIPLSSNQVVLDANYKSVPEKNYFGDAQRLDGLNWLIHQGYQSYRTFFGQSLNIEGLSLNRVRAFLQGNRNFEALQRIVLIGFMGTGKTSIGKRLAVRMGWDFLDTDAMCEEAAGKTIPAIFHNDGEERFRTLEQEQVKKSLQSKDTIIALGGGALMTPGIPQMLNGNTFTIWLYQPKDIIEKRCSESTQRPLFDPGTFKNLMNDRVPSYLFSSDLIMNSTGGSETEICTFLASEFSFLS